jgi:hypothetical protein
MPMPPCATKSSKALLGRLKSSAVWALSSATRIEPYWVLSSLCSITIWPVLSKITMCHRPIVLHGLCLGSRHRLFGCFESNRWAIGSCGWRRRLLSARRDCDANKERYCDNEMFGFIQCFLPRASLRVPLRPDCRRKSASGPHLQTIPASGNVLQAGRSSIGAPPLPHLAARAPHSDRVRWQAQ